MTYYVAIDIGCLECGESSRVIGIFTTQEAADAAVQEPYERQKADWHGEHSFEVHAVSGIGVVQPEPAEVAV